MDLDDALAELVAQSGDRLLRVAYQLTHDPAAAQDLVQDALAAQLNRQPRAPSQTREKFLLAERWIQGESFVYEPRRGRSRPPGQRSRG